MTKVNWANKLTAEFWRCLNADPKAVTFWTREAGKAYRMEFEGIPHPGVWPKFMGRVNLAMWIHQEMEEGGRGVPKGFAAPLEDPELSQVDCYSLAERILDDALVERMDKSGKMDSWAQFVTRKAKKKKAKMKKGG